MFLAQGQIYGQISLFMCLLAVLGSQGIVVKCTAAIFFRLVDLRRNGTGNILSVLVLANALSSVLSCGGGSPPPLVRGQSAVMKGETIGLRAFKRDSALNRPLEPIRHAIFIRAQDRVLLQYPAILCHRNTGLHVSKIPTFFYAAYVLC